MCFRSGPFYNHQHLDQGSFFLADRGEKFIEERYDGDHHYYDDPLYQSHAIQSISHNTILIDGNPQSQDVGDPKDFAAGMSRHASFESLFDSTWIAAASGRLDPVYNGKVEGLFRHVIYLKPSAVLIVDTVTPGDSAVSADLLFHTKWKDQIEAGEERSLIVKDSASLTIEHLLPEKRHIVVNDEPHFLSQFDDRPLRRRGYLSVSAKASGQTVVFANLLYSTVSGDESPFARRGGNGGEFKGGGTTLGFHVNSSGEKAEWNGFESDALVLAEKDGGFFILNGTSVSREGNVLLSSSTSLDAAVTVEEGAVMVNYHLGDAESSLSIRCQEEPEEALLDGAVLDRVSYSGDDSLATLVLPGGGHCLELRY